MFEIWQIVLIVLVSFIIFVLLLLEILISTIMKKMFNHRGDGCLRIVYPLPSDYPNLNKTKISFKTSKGNVLYGFEYKANDISTYKGVLLLVHGIGCGHFYFLNLVNYFAKEGYIVVCYDQSGSGMSTGSKIHEMSQALPDVVHAYHYVDKMYPNYDIYVAGHSWGGYAALNALNIRHNRIKKVVAIAGFNSHLDIALGTNKGFRLAAPGLILYDLFRHGKYAFWSAVRGLKKAKCPVMCVHAENDVVVPLKQSYERYLKVSKKKNNVIVQYYLNKAHAPFVTSSDEKYCADNTANLGMLGQNEPPYDLKLDFKKHYQLDDLVVSSIIEFLNK